jgi:hypothetical protein
MDRIRFGMPHRVENRATVFGGGQPPIAISTIASSSLPFQLDPAYTITVGACADRSGKVIPSD